MLIAIVILHITKDILTYCVVKNWLLLFIYPKFGSKFLCVFLPLLTYITATFLAALKAFPSLTPSSGKCWVGKYSTACISVMVPLVVASL